MCIECECLADAATWRFLLLVLREQYAGDMVSMVTSWFQQWQCQQC
jgi:hypothetical protein